MTFNFHPVGSYNNLASINECLDSWSFKVPGFEHKVVAPNSLVFNILDKNDNKTVVQTITFVSAVLTHSHSTVNKMTPMKTHDLAERYQMTLEGLDSTGKKIKIVARLWYTSEDSGRIWESHFNRPVAKVV